MFSNEYADISQHAVTNYMFSHVYFGLQMQHICLYLNMLSGFKENLFTGKELLLGTRDIMVSFHNVPLPLWEEGGLSARQRD